MSEFRKESIRMLAVVAVLAAAGATPAHAVETIRLTVVASHPPQATWVKALHETFIPKVNEALAKSGKYKIDWNEAYSGTIVKMRADLEGIQSGLGDMGIVVTSFLPDRLPLHRLTFVTPFVSSDIQLVTGTMNALERSEPDFKKIWDRHNVVSLGLSSNVDNMFLMTKMPVKSIADLKGRKIGGGGPNLPFITVLGATGVQNTLADTYTGLATGLVEGTLLWAEAAKSFRVCEQAPYIFDPRIGASQNHALVVNKDVWNKLPEDVRRIMTEVGPQWSFAASQLPADLGAEALEWCKANHKTVVTTVSPEERAKWVAMLPNDAKKWAADLERAGIPGNAILKAYMDRMRAANQPIARQWDQE
jgi:TRAP-type C4-dicarboxylate transport system substrate-binding protein